jgi:hypothetical protein
VRGGRERAGGVALAQGAVQHAVALDGREQRRRALGQGRLGLGQRGQRLVLHADQVERVVRRVDVLGHDRGHRDAGGVYEAVGQDRMGWHPHVGHQPVHRHRREVRGVGAGHHQPHPRGAARGLDVEPRDAGVSVRGAQERHVEAARGPQIVHVAARAGQEAMVLAPLERPPDPAVTLPVAMRVAHPRNRETASTSACGCS